MREREGRGSFYFLVLSVLFFTFFSLLCSEIGGFREAKEKNKGKKGKVYVTFFFSFVAQTKRRERPLNLEDPLEKYRQG